MWHCPNCGAPQAETARCWVCRRSSTTCSTCTHFRRALAGDLGYCGLDARRRPLTGRELRGCWEQRDASTEPRHPRASLRVEPHRLRGGHSTVPAADAGETTPPLDFVPIESLAPPAASSNEPEAEPSELARPAAGADSASTAPPAFVIEPDPGWGERTSLFGDPEG